MLADLPDTLAKTQPPDYIKYRPVSLSQYADDIAIWQPIKIKHNRSDKKIASITKIFQHSINIIHKLMTNNGFNFSSEKTQLIMFSQKTIKHKIKLFLNNEGVIHPLSLQNSIKIPRRNLLRDPVLDSPSQWSN